MRSSTELELLRRCVRLSWEPSTFGDSGQQTARAERYVTGALELPPECMTPPPAELAESLVQSIGQPPIMLQARCRGDRNMDDRRFFEERLDESERQRLLDWLGYDLRGHMTQLLLVPRQGDVKTVVGYLAATFALTTLVDPCVVEYRDLVQEAYRSTLDDTEFFSAYGRFGLLVVQYPVGNYPGAEKASGVLFSLFAKRADTGRPTVFVDVPTGAFREQVTDGGIRKSAVEQWVRGHGTPGAERLSYYLAGPETRIQIMRRRG